ncbi:hypothetical protein [Acinetobacter bereziniae]|uniref:hypothetical protein n=1 Tax=Acinetobacter bereziniae TaxID=106648 RepID=UPI0019019BD5|nr:hypothetical protein [Acinetobacter bereziniae]MBJ8553480.1 hypothetical protein [Acinetobacter bereziniae]
MNLIEWFKILKTDKLIVLVIVLGSTILLYLSEFTSIITLPDLWKNIFFCAGVFGGLFLFLSVLVSLAIYLKKIYSNRDKNISYEEYIFLEFFSKLPDQGILIEKISGIEETEKRNLLRILEEKGLLSSYIDYYSLTDKGRSQILKIREKNKKINN